MAATSSIEELPGWETLLKNESSEIYGSSTSIYDDVDFDNQRETALFLATILCSKEHPPRRFCCLR
jgi:hypothetical protein